MGHLEAGGQDPGVAGLARQGGIGGDVEHVDPVAAAVQDEVARALAVEDQGAALRPARHLRPALRAGVVDGEVHLGAQVVDPSVRPDLERGRGRIGTQA